MNKEKIIKLLQLVKKNYENRHNAEKVLQNLGWEVNYIPEFSEEIAQVINMLWCEVFYDSKKNEYDESWLDWWCYECFFGQEKLSVWISDKEYVITDENSFADFLVDWVNLKKGEPAIRENLCKNEESTSITLYDINHLGCTKEFNRRLLFEEAEKIVLTKTINNGLVQLIMSNTQDLENYISDKALTKIAIIFVPNNEIQNTILIKGLDSVIKVKTDYKSEKEKDAALKKISDYVSCYI